MYNQRAEVKCGNGVFKYCLFKWFFLLHSPSSSHALFLSCLCSLPPTLPAVYIHAHSPTPWSFDPMLHRASRKPQFGSACPITVPPPERSWCSMILLRIHHLRTLKMSGSSLQSHYPTDLALSRSVLSALSWHSIGLWWTTSISQE